MSKASVITAKQEQFCIKFVELGDETEAYRAAFPGNNRATDKGIKDAARKLLRQSKIIARITQLRDRVAEQAVFGAAEVIKHLVDIATADPNEIVSYRRTNCRYCNGRDHLYHWIDANELARVTAEVLDNNARAKSVKFAKPLPDDLGGYGFNPHDEPNPACPRCFGNGVEALHIADTRKLKIGARRLYAGVKKSKEGIEVKMHDQAWALGLLAKHFKVIAPDNGPTINVNTGVTNIADGVAIPLDPQDAAKFYQNLMQGKK